MKQAKTTKQPLEGKKYVPYGINGMYYIYDNDLHFMLPGQAGSSSRRMIKRKCEQLNAEEAQQTKPDSKEGLHTQGEWFVDERNGKIFIETIGKDGDETTGATVCQMYGNDPIDKIDAEFICKAVNERKALPELLKNIYHAIDIRCFSETENVSMTAIREELVKLGANEKDLW